MLPERYKNMACEETWYEPPKKSDKNKSNFPGWLPVLCVAASCAVFSLAHPELYGRAEGGNKKAGSRTETGSTKTNSTKAVFVDDSIYANMEGVHCSAYIKYFYDDNGLLTEMLTYTQRDAEPRDWTPHTDEIWTYDSQGRITLYETHLPYLTETLSRQKIYEYSEKGCVMTVRNPDDTLEDTYTYDEQGRLVESYQTRRFRYPHQYFYSYDELGRQVSVITESPVYDYANVYDEDGNVESIQLYNKRMETLVLETEWDDKNFTSREKKCNSQGELLGAWFSIYAPDWQQTCGVWCNGDEVPAGETDYLPYCKLGYWAEYREGLLVEKLVHERDRDSGNTGFEFQAFDYDRDGNITQELAVYSSRFTMYRYVYDEQGLLKETFRYENIKVPTWEQELCDGSVILISWDEEQEKLSTIVHRSAEGDILNLFEFDERGRIDAQCIPDINVLQEPFVQGEDASGLVRLSWKETAIALAEERAQDNQEEPGETVQPEEEEGFLYMVQVGDCLWTIAEQYLGDGAKWPEIYNMNVDVIGDEAELILPGMMLKIPAQEIPERFRQELNGEEINSEGSSNVNVPDYHNTEEGRGSLA